MAIPEFERIGPYHVIRTLGRGGMGTVYHGVHAKTQDPVAIKVIASSMAQHQRFRRRFDAEIQTLLRLKHPGIVQLIGFGEEKGLLFYSMEYVDGENLQQLLRKEKQLTWQRVLDLVIEVCAALKHAHDFGIIHRDLKPANLMINTQGRVKLTDFGIAKLFGAADSTVEGAVIGTADFMAPEQAEGKPVTVRSDLYALGSVCYAALTGRAPFQGKNIPEVLFNVRYGTYPPLETLVPQVPPPMRELIDELLQRDPSKRPPTALVVGNRFQSIRMGLASLSGDLKPAVDARQMKELTSIEIDDSRASTPSRPKNNDNTIFIHGKTNELTSLNSKQVMASSENLDFIAGPHDKTHVQHSISDSIPKPEKKVEEEFSDPPSGIEFIGKTNFTEVQDVDRRRSIQNQEPHHESSGWGQWIGISFLSVALIACIVALIWLLQAPSANQLYSEIATAIDANDDDQWLAVEPAAIRFKELYPNDERMKDIDATLEEIDSIRFLKRLQRKARQGQGSQLAAIEQAFLECNEALGLGSESAKAKLEAFLTLYGSSNQLSDLHRKLVARIRRILEQATESKKTGSNEAFRSLKEEMDWADANLAPAARRQWLEAMVELFQSKAWAIDLVSRAKRELTALQPN